MRNKLPAKIGPIEMGVINLDNAENPGTHWVAYKKYGQSINYFDSFGNLRPPLEVINYFKSDKKSNTILYNHDAFQSYNEINCGHLCLKFLYKKNK